MAQLRFTTAQQVWDAFPSLQDLITVRPLDLEPLDYIRKLLKSETPEEALGFCAYLMAKRDAVKWLCQLLRSTGQSLSPGDVELVKLAEEWVRSPNEVSRSTALAAGLASKDRNAAAWVAIAAGWSGGNMSSDDMHPVPAPQHLTAQGVTVALKLLIASSEKSQHVEKIEEYANSAIGLLKQS